MFTDIQNFDMNLLLNLHDHCSNIVLDKLMPCITYLGDNGFIWIIIGLVLIIGRKQKRTGILLFIAIISATILGEVILKNIIQRPRPYTQMYGIKLLVPKLGSYSFPSGHTAVAAAVSVVLIKELKKYSIPFVFLAALIAFSRMYLLVHYPTDILGGIILGVACGITILYCSKNILNFLNRLLNLLPKRTE